MDSFLEDDFFWKEIEFSYFNYPFPVNQSAFVSYVKQSPKGLGSNLEEKKSRNVKNRMMEFLKKNWASAIGAVEAERERNRKHMINERMRRDKEKQSYDELHKLLPHGTRRDKKSIVQMAAREIEELERYKAKLQKRNNELEKALGADSDEATKAKDEAKIKLRVECPSSGIDSMLEVLKCLNSKGCTAKSIQSNFSALEFSALLQIETSIGAAEVENAVQWTLFEVEKKFRCSDSGSEGRMSASARFPDNYGVIK